jgi:outer membrane protein assembly factor BamB
MSDMPTRARRAGARPVAGLLALVLSIAACSAASPTSPPGSPGATAGPAAAASGTPANPTSGTAGPTTAPATSPAPGAAVDVRFPGGLLIADRGNGRILAIDAVGTILWQFPKGGTLPAGQQFAADDAFLAPDGKTIVANDETHQVIDRIDIKTRTIVWQYGHYGEAGSRAGYLHNPDDAYPLANGNIIVADIVNCRILEIAPSKEIVRTLGKTGVCRSNPPSTYNEPNGDTPLPDGGMLITEIRGSRVVRLAADGTVVFDIHVPALYPSDAQLDANGNIVIADYSNPGAVMGISPTGVVLWRYAPTSGTGRLDRPSLATPLADGTVAVNDDFRHRMIVIDPKTLKIVWQYGHTDVLGTAPGYLRTPDGHQPIPAGTSFQ